MKRSSIFDLPFYLEKPPDYLWSRGWYDVSDEFGNGSVLYPAHRTERRSRSLKYLKGKSGLIWLRMGSCPWHKGRPSDVIQFADDVVGNLGGKTVLVTTDGDMSVPGDLPREAVEAILGDSNITAWYTQNRTSKVDSGKLRSIPIGLDFHTGIGSRPVRPKRKASSFVRALFQSQSIGDRINRIWCDVHFKVNPGRHGDPRGILQEEISSSGLGALIDAPDHRLTYEEVWRRYGSYRFVISLPGHGLDTHRTWEALALGAVVLTVHTPLDELLEPYRIGFLDEENRDWIRQLTDNKWLDEVWHNTKNREIPNLTWKYWENIVRSSLQ